MGKMKELVMEPKFSAGDKIKTMGSTTYHYATIERTASLDNGDTIYYVEWFHHPGNTFDYKASDVDSTWELELPAGNCPVVKYYESTKESDDIFAKYTDFDAVDKGCDHKWVNYHGFNTSYQFCEKCDEKRPM
jgi:hypothetical protein